MTISDSSEQAKSKSTSPHWWCLTPRRLASLTILIAAAIWFGRFAYLRITLRPTPRPQYWEAKLAELDPPPPGAISPEEASKILASRPFVSDPVLAAIPNFEISDVLAGDWDVNRQDIAAAVKVFESQTFLDARAELQRAIQAGWRDRVKLNLNSFFRSYIDYRAWAKWLVARSRWSHVRGYTDAAVEDWLAVFQLSRQVRREQTLIAHLVEIAIVSLVAHEVVIACQENLEPLDVARFVEQVDEILGKPVNAGDVLKGEAIYEQNMLESFFVRDGGNWIDVSELVAIWHSMSMTTLIKPSRMWNLASPLFHDFETARQNMQQLYAVYDPCKSMADCRELEQRTQGNTGSGRPTVLDGVMDFSGQPWSFTRAPLLYYRSRCFIEAALTSLAIHEYHRQHSHYPEMLSELVPKFLPRIPIDYADGQPMRYQRTQDGYLLYSIGEDGRDDEGRCDNKYPGDFNRGPDVVFSKMKRSELGR